MQLTEALNNLSDVEFNELLQKAYDRPDGEPFRIENIRMIQNRKEVTIKYQTSGKTDIIEL